MCYNIKNNRVFMNKSMPKLTSSLKYKIKRRLNEVGIDLENLVKVADID